MLPEVSPAAILLIGAELPTTSVTVSTPVRAPEESSAINTNCSRAPRSYDCTRTMSAVLLSSDTRPVKRFLANSCAFIETSNLPLSNHSVCAELLEITLASARPVAKLPGLTNLNFSRLLEEPTSKSASAIRSESGMRSAPSDERNFSLLSLLRYNVSSALPVASSLRYES